MVANAVCSCPLYCWKAIDFGEKCITINHTVQRAKYDDKTQTLTQDRVKRSASYRTFPMPESISAMLKEHKDMQGIEQSKPNNYLFVDSKGDVIKPDYVSTRFSHLLQEKGLRHIRFHDLRHGCAGILISDRVPLIEVQQWMGHSTISTTVDLYAHLDFSMKERSANSMKKLNI